MSVTHTITGGLVHLSGNIIQVTLTASHARPKHKLAVKVTFDGPFGSPAPEEIAPDENLQAVFHINGLIDLPPDYDFAFPATEKAVAHSILAKVVTLDIGEVYNNETGDRTEAWMNISENNVLRILKGKLRPYDLSLLNEAGKSFADEYIDGGKFLTNLANNQQVSDRQEMKLWYLSRWTEEHAATLHLEVKSDISGPGIPEGAPIEYTDDITLTPSGLMEFTVNPYFFGFNIPPGVNMPADTKALEYTFWLTHLVDDDIVDISERRRFVVDNRPREKEFVFYYVNTLSGVDCVRFTGEYSEKIPTESEQSFKPVPAGSGTKVGSLVTTSANSQRIWEINTGPKSADEMRGLRDFLDSKQRWMVDPQRDVYKKLIPVYIDSRDFQIFDSMENIQNFAVTVFESHK
ncbi:MAG: hypothetical protein A2066_12800 [Bacteroidetes bacterium GWB2_41_8]|nr:MAG: hypothetical protein A2066_12800 [Bacteroidetes bacterium GWB2_41_8]